MSEVRSGSPAASASAAETASAETSSTASPAEASESAKDNRSAPAASVAAIVIVVTLPAGNHMSAILAYIYDIFCLNSDMERDRLAAGPFQDTLPALLTTDGTVLIRSYSHRHPDS